MLNTKPVIAQYFFITDEGDIPPGTRLAGLFGRYGDYLDALGVILRSEQGFSL